MRTLIHGGTLFDAVTRGTRPASVLVEDGRIADVIESGPLPEVDKTIDAAGCTVMPGLINVHVHLGFMYMTGPVGEVLNRGDGNLYAHAFRISRLLLAQGITLARDMGGPRGIHLAVRDSINAGTLIGPRVLACGSPLVATGRHAWHVCQEADGPDAVVGAVRDQFKAGADFIKLMASDDPVPGCGGSYTLPGFSAEEVAAAYQEVRRHDALACCHVMGEEAIRNVLDAGADIIDHGHYLTDELAHRMADQGTYLTPTISSYDVQTAHPRFDRGEAWAEKHRPLLEGHRLAVAAAVRAGVRMLIGTDTVGCYAEEIALLREAGMNAEDTLLACTRWAAEALRQDAECGTVEVGKRADLVVIDGDPLRDPYAIEKVRVVLKEGRAFDPAVLMSDDDAHHQPLWPLARAPLGGIAPYGLSSSEVPQTNEKESV